MKIVVRIGSCLIRTLHAFSNATTTKFENQNEFSAKPLPDKCLFPKTKLYRNISMKAKKVHSKKSRLVDMNIRSTNITKIKCYLV